jgi:methionyl-tRNA formyltransferase
MANQTGGASLRVVVIADASPFNDWLLPRVAESVPFVMRVRPDWSDVATTQGANVRPPGLTTRLRRRLRGVWYAAGDREHALALAAALGAHGPSRALATPTFDVPSRALNAEASLERLRASRPDVVLVSGAPILSSALCDIAPLGTFNLHLGIAPAYRGMHTLFVPWQRGDWRHLGATLHHVSQRVDAGAAILRAYPALRATDTLADVEARLAPLLATELVAFLSALRDGSPRARPDGQQFAADGASIRFHDRRIRDDLAAGVARLAGRRPQPQDARVERFYPEVLQLA